MPLSIGIVTAMIREMVHAEKARMEIWLTVRWQRTRREGLASRDAFVPASIHRRNYLFKCIIE